MDSLILFLLVLIQYRTSSQPWRGESSHAGRPGLLVAEDGFPYAPLVKVIMTYLYLKNKFSIGKIRV